MADVTVQVEEARADIRKAGAAINWMLCDWQAGRAEKLDLTASGNGGWDEFKTHLQPDKASFGYLRINYNTDAESSRERFLFVTWIGDDCPVMRRAKTSVQAAQVQSVLQPYSKDICLSGQSDKDKMTSDQVISEMLKVGGANYGPGK